MEKLYLLDAYALIYRAYYALIRTPRINSKGMNTSAVFGFVNTLEERLEKSVDVITYQSLERSLIRNFVENEVVLYEQ